MSDSPGVGGLDYHTETDECMTEGTQPLTRRELMMYDAEHPS